MSPYDEVLAILAEAYGWPSNLKPEPEATNAFLLEHDAQATADTLETYCQSTGANTVPPYGFDGDGYEWVRYDYFKGGEYWSYYTQMALGVIVEPPVDKWADAKSVSEWFSHQAQVRTRQGFVILDLDNEFGLSDWTKRQEMAAFIPAEWSALGKHDHWRLSCIEGYIKFPTDAFSAAYAVQTPSLDSIRFLDSQQWLDNLRCDDNGKPRKWTDDGKPNPEFKGF
jgi:hypothetical protein